MTRKIRSITGEMPLHASLIPGAAAQDTPENDFELRWAGCSPVGAIEGCNVHMNYRTGQSYSFNGSPRNKHIKTYH